MVEMNLKTTQSCEFRLFRQPWYCFQQCFTGIVRFPVNAFVCYWRLGYASAVLVLLQVLLGFTLPCMAESRFAVTNVSLRPQFFSPANGEVTQITYKLSQAANVTIKIYDESDYLVKTVLDSKSRSEGDNKESWDGTDAAGHSVLPGIYRFTIEAKNNAGETVLSDLTDLTGGQENQVASSKIDVEKGLVTYVLRSPSLVITRLGLGEGGPMLRTLEYRKAKPGGLNHIPWNGFDNSGAVKLLKHPKLSLRIEAYSLNANSIVVVGPKEGYNTPTAPVKMAQEKRLKRKATRKIIRNHWQHSPDRCRDPEVKIILPPGTQRDPDGIPVVTGPLRLRVDVSDQDRMLVTEERFEVMFFVDFIFVCEEEAGFFPYNWTWNPQTRSEGLHTITVNLIGYEDHIGSATIRVRLKQ